MSTSPSSAESTSFFDKRSLEMQDQRVIYPTDEGGVAVIVPAPDATLKDVLKAVPYGKPHKVVDVKDVPSDRTFRNAWEYQE
jgi:hypothetical protein